MSETLEIGGRALEVSRRGKVLFPGEGITKGDLIDYAAGVAETALPHLRGRPLSLERYPDGIGADGFFQKQAPDHAPDWIPRAELPKEGGTVDYLMAEEPAALVWLADQGAIAWHAALSRADRPDHPDRLVLDLDPSRDADFAGVQRGAEILRDLLDRLEAPAFVQTTGSRGLHVVVPLDRGAAFETARALARDLAERAAAADPDRLTVEHRKAKRGDRVFVDWLRNAYGQTAVAPYSPRAKPGAPVATPLDWEEALDPGMSPRGYHVGNILRRLGQKADPWADIARHAVSAEAAARRLEALD
jgi:bifunctional non-homologous end joining protein LigD